MTICLVAEARPVKLHGAGMIIADAGSRSYVTLFFAESSYGRQFGSILTSAASFKSSPESVLPSVVVRPFTATSARLFPFY